MFRKSLVLALVLTVSLSAGFALAQQYVSVITYTGTPVKQTSQVPASYKLDIQTPAYALIGYPDGAQYLFRILSDHGASMTFEGLTFVAIADFEFLDLAKVKAFVYWFNLDGQEEAWAFREPVRISLFAGVTSFASVVYQEDDGRYVQENYYLHQLSSVLVRDAVEIFYSSSHSDYQSSYEVTSKSYFICDNPEDLYGSCEEIASPESQHF